MMAPQHLISLHIAEASWQLPTDAFAWLELATHCCLRVALLQPCSVARRATWPVSAPTRRPAAAVTAPATRQGGGIAVGVSSAHCSMPVASLLHVIPTPRGEGNQHCALEMQLWATEA